jgi:hypothetical protein
MTTVEQIKDAIRKLPANERQRIAEWIDDAQDEAWDSRIAADAKAGALDEILKEVDRDIDSGLLRSMP